MPLHTFGVRSFPGPDLVPLCLEKIVQSGSGGGGPSGFAGPLQRLASVAPSLQVPLSAYGSTSFSQGVVC